jgi:hypothetical protein
MASHVIRPTSALTPETRQTYRILCKASIATHACRVMPSACVQRLLQAPPSQRRSYAAPASIYTAPIKTPRVRKAPPPDTARATNIAVPALEFSPGDIPPMTVWESVLGLAPEDLTLKDLDGAARKYCAVATKGTSTWKGKLEKSRQISSPPR